MSRSESVFSLSNQESGNQKKIWRILGFCALLIILYIPFGIALNVSADIDLASVRIIIPAFFLIWLAAAAFLKKKLLISSFQGFGLIAIATISAASLAFASELGWGIRKLAVFLSIFPLYFFIAGLACKKIYYQKIINTLILGAFISSVIGLTQFFSQFFVGFPALIRLYSGTIGPIFWGGSFSGLVVQNPSWFVSVGGGTLMRAFGLFPDPHMMAFFLGLVLPLAIVKVIYAKKTGYFLVACTVIMLAVLLLTFSRGGYLGLFFSITVILFYSWTFLDRKKKSVILTGSVLSLLILLIFAVPIVSRFISSFLLSEGSSLGRLQIWKQSILVFLDNPVFGKGLGNYSRAVDPLAVYRNPITSHNLYLDIAAETGIFGLAAWLFLLSGSFCQLAVSLKKDRAAPDSKTFLKIGLAGSLAYFAVHSFFETSIFNPAILACLMIVLALISVNLKPARQ
ncbi:MAG: hypothetical protein A2Y98_01400 [Candidatus Portnoybacteria bacterium RBG_19FT_COMBO_36_7]|uniref:O-antigen ligase-related domain-containing protein n=1 Tax=Candidatus Portnoybacteria bacterium RBG_19FT_COMBO_36_7 TaxID=1801992 RepID=A0A1G2F6F7_9BACT|nr:MAG: hypothetical protein A2Y98_01400 [Candidatus Portnoybacteria bacterium RBG_19FT_COMBO_36_7]